MFQSGNDRNKREREREREVIYVDGWAQTFRRNIPPPSSGVILTYSYL
jgi:hypothetical protein